MGIESHDLPSTTKQDFWISKSLWEPCVYISSNLDPTNLLLYLHSYLYMWYKEYMTRFRFHTHKIKLMILP